MVQIEITTHQKTYQQIQMTGHAEAGEYGSDLVCAALTGIMSGALNAIDEKFGQDVKITVQNNFIKVQFFKTSPALISMIEMLIIQLKTIAIQYPQNVQLKEVN